MMRSLYSGVSGLQNHQTRMDVIGNNISNVNTTAFKKDRVTFQDMLYQNSRGASEPKENIGGINAHQVGLGMLVASIDKIMTQGALQTTGKNTDVAMAGDGFFVVREGNKKYYTRSGTFDVDRDGYYVNPANGNRVQGWMAAVGADGKKSVNSSGEIQDIVIPLYSKEPARETANVVFRSNLNSAVEPVPATATEAERLQMINDPDPAKRRGHVTSINVYDDQGNTHNVRLTMWKTADNRWMGEVDMSDVQQLGIDVATGGGTNTQIPENRRFQLNFTPDGKIQSISDGVDSKASGKLDLQLNFRYPGNPQVRTINLNIGDAASINGVTQFASDFTTKAAEQDGYPMGYMESFVIDNTGTITGVYTNGQRQELARIATAIFTNAAGMDKAGENRYMETTNSGRANIGEAGMAGRGKINAGLLEMSNVDLSESFTDMIVTQRGFQANSRTVTTADQLIQEVLGLKR